LPGKTRAIVATSIGNMFDGLDRRLSHQQSIERILVQHR